MQSIKRIVGPTFRGVYPYLPMAPMRHGQFLGGIYFY